MFLFFKEFSMKKYRFLSAMLAMALVFGLVLSGCTTTHAIDFAGDTQPPGAYKQAVIKITTRHFSDFFGSVSVLQRFYEQYPATQYEVVAIEKVSNSWITAAAAVVGGGLGSGIGAAISYNDEREGWTSAEYPIIIGVSAIFAGIGGFTGYMFSNSYVVTYVERQGVVPLTTQGPQG